MGGGPLKRAIFRGTGVIRRPGKTSRVPLRPHPPGLPRNKFGPITVDGGAGRREKYPSVKGSAAGGGDGLARGKREKRETRAAGTAGTPTKSAAVRKHLPVYTVRVQGKRTGWPVRGK